MDECRWIFRPAAILILAAGVGSAQPRRPNYNFFDSREQGSAASGLTVAAERLGGALTAPATADAETIARAFLEEHREQLGLVGASVFSLPLERRYESPAASLTHLWFRQQYAGIPVFGGDVLAHVTGEGSLLQVQAGARWPAGAGPVLNPALTVAEAAAAAARTLEPERAVPPAEPARLVWFPRTADAVLAWELYLHFGPGRWFCAVVDASTGELLFSHNLYREQIPRGAVFRASDVPNPNAGPRSLEPFTGWPAPAGNCPASIYPPQYRSGSLLNHCWVNGAETAGNNVVACLDATGLNQCDWKAYSAQADFEFAFGNSYALSGDAVPDRSAAVTNLFYWNNALHDWLYGLGFDEAAGNFQADNFGRGGFGGDPVLADAQDGSGLNNSNFATPPDGSSPRMQIFLFTDNGTFLRRDGDFDGDIITHEYVHGLTTRLVGGPGNVNVLPLVQSAALGEGWGDAYACSFTNSPVMGEYVSATPATGIRSVAYDNSPHTFGRLGTLYRRNVGPLS
ncbi:MAG: M36 family metallopeptidase, partial [Acidobacteria bacterium]|nr:M36 family metallopeptidase [Acidobacteriota bacterium]